jgi:hypothetical protein
MIREMMRGVDTCEEAKDKVMESGSEDDEATEEKKRQI